MKKTAMACLMSMVIGAASVGAADKPPKSFGVHGGFGLNPDQVVIGAQSELGKLSIARFAPSVNAGFGDNVTVYAFNADVRLHGSPPESRSAIYLGGGPTLALIDPKGTGSDTEIGLSLVAGIKVPMGSTNAYTLEGRLGTGDIPDFRLLVGILFGGQGGVSR